MKCTKCGAECKDTQTFCLNCGTPLHADQKLNEIEEELANNVGAMLDAFDDDDDDDDIEDYVVQFDQSVFEEEALNVQKELQVDNIYSGNGRRNADEEEDEEDWEYDEDKYFDDMMEDAIEEDLMESHPKTESRNKKQKKKTKNNKKIAITCSVVVIVLAIAIGGGIYLLNNVHFNLTSYEDYYRMASKEYKRADYSMALKDAQSALRKAEKSYDTASNDDKKKDAKKNLVQVRELIHDIYEKTDKIDDDYADNMLEIVTLEDSLSEYYVKLAKYYSDNKPPKVLTDFLRTVDDDNTEVVKALKDYIVPVPESDKDSGQYSAQFAVTLTCDENSTIWYTLDGQDPSTHGVQYTEPVKITAFRTTEDTNTENGVTVLKAITVNADKVESKVKEFRYEVVLSSAEPEVTPDSGLYTEYTEIKINVPQGSKCYYTIGDGSVKPADPDEKSTLYIANETEVPAGEKYEPLQMQRGTHIMKFVIIDEYGIASDVAVRSYNLEIPRNVTLNDAEKRVDEMMLAENIVNAEGKNSSNNTVKAKWEETIIVDNDEYYVVYAVEKNDAGQEISKTMYLVDSYDRERDVIKDAKYENGQYMIPEDETAEGDAASSAAN